MSTPKSELLKLGKRLGYTIEQGGRHVVLTHPTTGARIPVHNGSKLSTSMAHKISGQLRRGTRHEPSKASRDSPRGRPTPVVTHQPTKDNRQ